MKEYLVLYQDRNEDELRPILNHLQNNDIKSCDMSYNLDDETFEITVAIKEFKMAKQLLLTFFKDIMEAESQVDDENDDEDDGAGEDDEPAVKTFVNKKTQYEDLSSSAFTLLLVGTLGLVVLVLEIAGIIHLIPLDTDIKWVFYSTMGIVFLTFFIIGLFSYSKSKALKYEIVDEENLINTIRNWGLEHLSSTDIDHTLADDISETDLYFERYKHIKAALNAEFSDTDPSLIEELIEQLYMELFE